MSQIDPVSNPSLIHYLSLSTPSFVQSSVSFSGAGEYAGLVGEYAGLVGEYAGDVGLYAGDVGEYAGLVGL